MTGGNAPTTAGSGGTTGGSAGSSGGSDATAGGTTGGTAGSGGTSGGSSGSGGGGGKTLTITAAPKLNTHKVGGRDWAIDTRLPEFMGKLVVNLEVDDGNINDFAIKHGFHVYAAQIFHCPIVESQGDYTTKGKEFNGNCRLETFDGMNHNGGSGTTPETSIMGKVKAGLTQLAADYGEEGWSYFLDDTGNVRWDQVAFTGYSHGATSAARWAKKVKVWRVVSRSGPRDNLCGNGPNQPPQTNCNPAVISAWLDEESMTPVENYWGLVGAGDGQYGDILFAMERLKLVGMPTNINQVAPPYNGSHRLFISGGHDAFTGKQFWPALEVVWGTPKAINDFANAQ
jgi:hypothetical protein